MAIFVEANYSKKLGLPQYSSHQYSLTVKTEVNDLSQVESASSHLYRQLQDAVDRDIQETGFLPGTDNMSPVAHFKRDTSDSLSPDNWGCSPKQRDLVEKLMTEHRLSVDDVNSITHRRFGVTLPQLSKMQCSELIDFLIEHYRNPAGSLKRS